MKKIVLLLTIIVLVLMNNISLGYTDNYIKFIKPNGTTMDNNEMEYKILDIDGKSNIYIKISKNLTNKNSSNLTQDDLDSLNKEIKEQAEKEYNTNIQILNSKLSTVGKIYYRCIIYEHKIEKYELYQKIYMILSDNYIYSIALTSDKLNYFTNKNVEDFLTSIEIKDNITEYKNNANQTNNDSQQGILVEIISVIILILISNIIFFIQNKKIKK